jgi:hypothetical protein
MLATNLFVLLEADRQEGTSFTTDCTGHHPAADHRAAKQRSAQTPELRRREETAERCGRPGRP